MTLQTVPLMMQPEEQEQVDRPPTIEPPENDDDATNNSSDMNELARMNDSPMNETPMNKGLMNANDSRRLNASDEEEEEAEEKEEQGEVHLPEEESRGIGTSAGELFLTEAWEDNQVKLNWASAKMAELGKPETGSISAYAIEGKSANGNWREIKRVSSTQTETIIKIDADFNFKKFRIKTVKDSLTQLTSGTAESQELKGSQSNISGVAEKLREMTLVGAEVISSSEYLICQNADRTRNGDSGSSNEQDRRRNSDSSNNSFVDIEATSAAEMAEIEMNTTPSATALPPSPASSQTGALGEDAAASGSTPAWKKALIDKRVEQKKQKDEEEEALRRKWSELPEWKRKLLESKGKTQESFSISDSNLDENEIQAIGDNNDCESDGSDDSANEKSAQFWGVKLKKQKSKSRPSSRESGEMKVESGEGGGGGGAGHYADGAKKIWGVSLKVTEKGENGAVAKEETTPPPGQDEVSAPVEAASE